MLTEGHTWSIFDILIPNIQEKTNWFNIKSKQEKKAKTRKHLKLVSSLKNIKEIYKGKENINYKQ